MSRFFISKDAVEGDKAVITGDDVLHIQKVLRMKIGDCITLCDGQGTDYECIIKEVSKKEIICLIKSFAVNQNEPPCHVTLFQGVPKGSKMDYIIQKCVELGVSKIVPVATKRSIAKADGKEERLNKISEEAAKQSGRGIIPKVLPVVDFKTAISMMLENDLAIMPYEEADDKTLQSVLRGKNPKSIGILIGPEGGFDTNEANLALDENIQIVTLGKRILRTETAGMAVISNIMYEYQI